MLIADGGYFMATKKKERGPSSDAHKGKEMVVGQRGDDMREGGGDITNPKTIIHLKCLNS